MLSIFRFIIFFSWILISCNSEKDSLINNNSSHYSKTNLDFIEGISSQRDSLFFRAKIEINFDSNKVSSWNLNGEKILKSELFSKLEEIQLRYPEKKRDYIAIDLGINKNIEVHQFVELRDSLRIGNYLKASYLNSNNQRLNVRFPVSDKMRQSKFTSIPPPPPPGIEELICLCCEKENKFTTSILNYRPKQFEDYFDCMRGSNLNESFTYVHLEKDKFYWQGNELDLSTIADSLEHRHTNYFKPNRFFTILKIDSLSTFESYLDLYAVCRKVYVNQWNEESFKMFASLYKDLPREDKKKIRNQYPLILVEFFD